MPESITVLVNGASIAVHPSAMVSAAIVIAGETLFRRSVAGEPRGPLCGMGICFECRVTVNGQLHERSCQTICEEGMEVETDK
jgi:predicted molibdopterin-dependent oxidoreductase YjgC